MATGPPMRSFGPAPFRLTAKRPITKPSPANPVEHQRPVEYCWGRSWPLRMSTAWVVAAEMARARPEPIWNAVLSWTFVSRVMKLYDRGLLTIPPHRLLTSTGTLVKIVVLVVTKMNDTAEMLTSDVPRTLTQLRYVRDHPRLRLRVSLTSSLCG